MVMLRTLAALSLFAMPAVAVAQAVPDADTNVRTLAEAQASLPPGDAAPPETLAASNTPPQKVRSVVLVGDQKCPKSQDGEIIVCSHVDQGEQYRIPDQFRKLPNPAANNSWVNRAAVIDQVSREAGGLPNTCSVVGDGGQTGCMMQQFRQYQAEKRANQREQSSIP